MWNRIVLSGSARVRLLWFAAVVCALASAGLLLWPDAPARVAVAVVTAQPNWPKPRCPARTLEDDGVCIPVPAAPETAAQTLALQSDRPRPWDAYQLPVEGAVASLVPLQWAPVPEPFRVAGNALVLRAVPGAPVRCVAAPQSTTEIVALDRDAGWLLMRHRSAEPGKPLLRLLLLGGVEALAADITEGSPCEPGLVLGRALDAVTLAARRASPAMAVDAGVGWIAQFSSASSLTEDVRNLLPLALPDAAGSSSSEEKGTPTH